MKTTYQKIKDTMPCIEGLEELVNYYNPSSLEDEISMLQILKVNGLGYALRALATINDDKIMLFCADMSESVLHVYENENPENNTPHRFISAIRLFAENKITQDEFLEIKESAIYAYECAKSNFICTTETIASSSAAEAIACSADSSKYTAYHVAHMVADAANTDAKWEEITNLFIKHFK